MIFGVFMKKSWIITCLTVAFGVGFDWVISPSSELSAAEFSRALETRVGLSWNEVPIRDALNRFGSQTEIPIWLDRRVDVNFPVSGTFQNATPIQVLREALMEKETSDFGMTQIDGALYVGPTAFVERLRTLLALKREELEDAFSPATQKKWLTARPLEWERGATPREILTELCEERKFRLSGMKLLPHDVWTENVFPEMSALEAVTVILGQFGLTLEFTESKKSGEVATIVPLKLSTVHLTRNYPTRTVTEEKRNVIQEAVPTTRFAEREKDKKTVVRGILEVHEFLQKSDAEYLTVGGFTPAQLGMHTGTGKPGNAGRTPTGVERSLQRFSGTITAPFYPALKQLCDQQGMTLEADTDTLVEVGVELERIVTVKCQEATIEELFQQLAEAGGCVAEVRGDRVILQPPSSK